MDSFYLFFRRKFEWILTDGPNENVRKILKPEEAFSEGLSFLQFLELKIVVEVRKSIQHGDTIEVCPRGKAVFII